MRYTVGVIVPLVLQALFVFVVIQMNTGNGSWVGLGALLLGLFAIPATGIANFLFIRARPDHGLLSVIGPCFLMALAMPVIVLFMLIMG